MKWPFVFKIYYITVLAWVVICTPSCQKEITVDLPSAERKIVVEGSIEQGKPPIVLLTWSQGYFDPTDMQSLEKYYIKDAIVKVSNGSVTVPLDIICTSDLTPEQLSWASAYIGIPAENLAHFNICIYSSFNTAIWGEEGKMYSLTVEHGGHALSAVTKINHLVHLDSLWFKVLNPAIQDSLGFIFGTLTDPDTTGNAYRWFAKRINHYPQWVPDAGLAGEQKDFSYIAPLGSVIDDAFFNGLNFEFGYYRGSMPNSQKFDDTNEERGYFKRGDTVVVRGCVIDRGVFSFYSSFENQVSNQGSPFSLPHNVTTNITGGLGVWAGYGAVYDTLICE